MTYFLVVLIWLLISYVVARFIGAAIREADQREGTDRSEMKRGVVATAIREATADQSARPTAQRYAAMDEYIGVLGHDAVLKWLPADIVDDFNGKNEERRKEAEAVEKRRAARKAYYERRIAKAVDPVAEKRRIFREIVGDQPDYSRARDQINEALGRASSGAYTEVVDGTGRVVRRYAQDGIVRPLDSGPARW